MTLCRFGRCACVIALLALSASPLARSATMTSIARLSTLPVIDGVPDEPVWREAALFDAFVQVSPVQDGTPSRRTEVRIGQEGRTLFIAIRAHDPAPHGIVAQQMKRDVKSLLHDDHVALLFDPEGRGRNGFLFQVNANGAQRDSLIYDGGQERFDWDAIWDAAARIDAEGWTAELAIPLATLSANGSANGWGFNAERWVPQTSERVRLFGATADKEIKSLGDTGRVSDVQADTPGLGLRLKTSVRVTGTSVGARRDQSLEPGLEVFHQTSEGIRTSLAFNVDFGEAEADERVVNLTRFPLFQPEKREFFLQDAGRFSFGGLQESVLPFFSRRIGLDAQRRASDLEAGVKVAGSAAGLDFGVFGARVARGELPKAPEVGVVRVAGGLSDTSRLGMIATQGNPQGTAGSRLWGADYQYRNTRLDGGRTLDAFAWMQESVNAGLGTARAIGGSINYPNFGLNGSATIQRIDSNFLPALGFLAESGVTRSDGEIGWWSRTAKGGDIIPQLDWDVRGTRDGKERSIMLNPEIYMANAAGDYVFPEIFVERDHLASPFELVSGLVVPSGDYRWHYFFVEAGTSPSQPVAVVASARAGGFYDGRRNGQALKIVWSPNRHWGVRGTVERNDIDLPGGRFVVRTASLRLDHAVSTRLTKSLLLQWDNVSHELGTKARLRWTLAPGRELFFSLNRLSSTGSNLEPAQTSATLKLVWNWSP